MGYLTLNTWSNRVVSISSVITRYFNPVQYRDGHISTYFNKDTRELFILGILCFVPVIFVIVTRYLFICACYLLLAFIYFVRCLTLSFVLLFNFIPHRFFAFIIRCSLFERKKFNSDPELCSGISINEHHTADSTDFVLVWERRTYYDHRHCGIDETNILQVAVAPGLLAETVVRLRLRLPPPASQLAHIYMSG